MIFLFRFHFAAPTPIIVIYFAFAYTKLSDKNAFAKKFVCDIDVYTNITQAQAHRLYADVCDGE